MSLTPVLAVASFVCLVTGGVTVTWICWTEGVRWPWGQYRLVYRGLVGQTPARQSALIRVSVVLWVLALVLMVLAFAVSPAT